MGFFGRKSGNELVRDSSKSFNEQHALMVKVKVNTPTWGGEIVVDTDDNKKPTTPGGSGNSNPPATPGGNSNSSSSGCFITTAVCRTLQKPDDCEELTVFRQFRDTFMLETAEMRGEVHEYYQIAPQICAKIDELEDPLKSQKYAEILGKSLVPAFEALKGGNNQKAHDLYKEMVLGLKKEFLGIDVPPRT